MQLRSHVGEQAPREQLPAQVTDMFCLCFFVCFFKTRAHTFKMEINPPHEPISSCLQILKKGVAYK